MKTKNAAVIPVLCLWQLGACHAEQTMSLYDKAMQAGHSLRGKGDRLAAMGEFGVALALAENAADAARARNQIAFGLKEQKRYEEARVLLSRSLDAEDVDAGAKTEAQYLFGHSWVDQGNWLKAREAFAKLLQMQDLWPYAQSEASMIVGIGLVDEKKYEEGRTLLRQCLACEGGAVSHKQHAQRAIAGSFAQEGKSREAIAAYQALLKMPSLDGEMRKEAKTALTKLQGPNETDTGDGK
ncbi:MAG: hypothetical protein HYU36_21635 [Planctomycetes bacterium]|nr:hypothetical protein [Planctomycetota bacterium]